MTALRLPKITRPFSRLSQCAGKVGFGSFDAAKRAAANLTCIENEDDGEIRPYHCSHCGRHHIGHRPRVSHEA